MRHDERLQAWSFEAPPPPPHAAAGCVLQVPPPPAFNTSVLI
jgi:hypothetical protein